MDIQTSCGDLSLPLPSVNFLEGFSPKLNVPILLVLILLVILSGFFSMAETVFSSVSETRLRTYVEDRKTGAKKALICVEKFERTLTTLLVGNNIVNVLLSTLAVGFFAKLIQNEAYIELVSTLVITVILLIFGEITPKTLGKKYNDRLSLILGPIIYFLSFVLYPIVIIFMGIQKLIVGKKVDEVQVNEDELETILDTMEEEGSIESDEHEFIKNVFDLNDRKVEDIMVPRVDMIAIDADSSVDDAKTLFTEEQYSRVPVYEGDKDHIIGILYQRDFFKAVVNNISIKSLRDLMRPAKFVSKAMTVDSLIKTLQSSKMHMAIVSGEYNDTLGLVTMEDCLEEIVGEIYDEHDEEVQSEAIIEKIDDNTFIVGGDVYVSDMFEELEIGQSPEDSGKVSSWVFEYLCELPKIGDKMTYVSSYTKEEENGGYKDYTKTITLEVTKIDERRIELLKVTIADSTIEEIEAAKEEE